MNPMHHAPAQGPVRQDRLYVGGEWLDPVDGRLVDVINPLTEESIGRAALAGRADIDRAVRAARAAFDTGPWAASTVHERAAIMVRAGQLIAARAEEFTRTITLEVGSPLPIATVQPQRLQAVPRLARRAGVDVPVGGGARGSPGATAGAPPARRGGRRHRPVELPARAVVPEARAGAAHRLQRRPEAAGGDAAVRLPARGGLRGSRAAARRAERRRGRPRGQRGTGRAPAGRQDQLHRQHARRAPHRRAVRRAAQALQPRARRQVGRDRAARRRPRRGDPRAGAAHDDQQRPDLHEPDARARPSRALRRRRRGAPRDDRLLPRRRPRGSRRLHRPADQRRAAPAGRGLHRQGPRRGRAARARRRPSRSRPRVLRGADDLRRRRQQDDDRRRRSSARS